MRLQITEERYDAYSSIGKRVMIKTVDASWDTVPSAGSKLTVGQAEFLLLSVKEDILGMALMLPSGECGKQIKIESGKKRLYRPAAAVGFQYRIAYTE